MFPIERSASEDRVQEQHLLTVLGSLRSVISRGLFSHIPTRFLAWFMRRDRPLSWQPSKQSPWLQHKHLCQYFFSFDAQLQLMGTPLYSVKPYHLGSRDHPTP